MPKNKIGVIEKIGVDADGLEIFRVRVEAGTRKKRNDSWNHERCPSSRIYALCRVEFQPFRTRHS